MVAGGSTGMTGHRVAVDIGGTFTDFIVYDEIAGDYRAGKVPTTPQDLAQGVLSGFQSLDLRLDSLTFAVHGTTVGLNAFLQRSGERVLLLATKGLGDVYHVARGHRLTMYDVQYRKPTPLVPLNDIIEIGGRLDYRGEELEELQEQDVHRAIDVARQEGIKSIAIAFLFSYVNPAHELRVEKLFADAIPEINTTVSHRVVREWREYERTSSTVLEAYVAPVVRSYLARLESEATAGGLGVPLHVMQSNGGILTARGARERPLQTLLSGPVGGAMGGSALADMLGRPNLICVDMGGTSFDVSLIVDGRPDVAPEMTIEGLPILAPMVNIHTIGAGGGSIGHVQAGGLRVGPESAGSVPGPACYARGGTRPTVTDANLLLGRVDPDYFLGGTMRLDVAAAEQAMSELAAEFDLSALELADGILRVINSKMAQAIRTITVEKGIEARDFSLVAFGGAGPMHAAFLAQELEIPEIIIPPTPGAFSAWGMLQAPIRYDLVRMYYVPASDDALDAMDVIYQDLETEAAGLLAKEGIKRGAIQLERYASMRYEGQEYAVTVPITENFGERAGFVNALAERFHSTYERRHGHSNPGAPFEFVTLRLVALGDLSRSETREVALNGRADPLPTTQRLAVFKANRQEPITVIRRKDLTPGVVIQGPAIIEELTATTVVPPDLNVTTDNFGSLLIGHGVGES
jgi:N-methylhydantoinase A